MDPIDAVWHVLNFFAPALGLGMIASAIVKVLWHRELAVVSWARLSVASCGGAAAALVTGLIGFGHDGRSGSYAAMVVVAALCLWWVGFRPLRR